MKFVNICELLHEHTLGLRFARAELYGAHLFWLFGSVLLLDFVASITL